MEATIKPKHEEAIMANETTFENVKVNDKVYSLGLGWGRVTDIYLCSFFGLIYFSVQFDSGKLHYLPSGKVDSGGGFAVNQTLFWDEVKIVAPVKPVVVPPKDTLVLVGGKFKRYSAGVLSESGKLICYHNGANSITVDSPNMLVGWETWEVVI